MVGGKVSLPLEDYQALVATTQDAIELARRSTDSSTRANDSADKALLQAEAERKAIRINSVVKWILIFSLIASNMAMVGATFVQIGPFG